MDLQVKEPAALAARAAELDDSDPWAHLAYDGNLTKHLRPARSNNLTKKLLPRSSPNCWRPKASVRKTGHEMTSYGAWDMLIQANSLFWRLTKAESQAAIAILRQVVERYPT